jgi:hypothetical protein
VYCKAQDSTIYNKYTLSKFGIVYIPKGLDTFSQDLAKNEILEGNLDRLSKTNQDKIKSKYNVTVTKSFLENINKESYLFWPSISITNVLNPKFWKYDEDSVFGFDETKIEFLPCVTLRKVIVKASSDDFRKRIFYNKDTAKKYVQNLEDMMTGVFKQLYTEGTILESNSEYYFISNQFPVVRVSLHLSMPVDDKVLNFGQTTYVIFKNHGIYSLNLNLSLRIMINGKSI